MESGIHYVANTHSKSVVLGIISLSDLTADPHTGRPVAALDRLAYAPRR